MIDISYSFLELTVGLEFIMVGHYCLPLGDLLNSLLAECYGGDVREWLIEPSVEELATVVSLAVVKEGYKGSRLGVCLVLIRLYPKHLEVLIDLRVKVVVRES